MYYAGDCLLFTSLELPAACHSQFRNEASPQTYDIRLLSRVYYNYNFQINWNVNRPETISVFIIIY